MPIYEYGCQECLKVFEELVRGDEQVRCPYCGTDNIRRKISVCGFVSSNKFVSSAGSSACGGCSKNSCAGCASLTMGK